MRRQAIAVVIGFIAIGLAMVQPVWIRSTGSEVALEIRPIDPQSFFRGNYVDLNYDIEGPGRSDLVEDGATAYVVLNGARPADILRVTLERPKLAEGEFCVRGKVDNDRVAFPNLEQFFVTPELGLEIENSLNTMVAVVKTTGACRSVLVDVQPE
jgi:uncharacterized membrane-anchored protein